MITTRCLLVFICIFVFCGPTLRAQKPDIPPVQDREKFIVGANELLAQQKTLPIITEPIPDPFVGKIDIIIKEDPVLAPVGAALIEKLANRIPVTGSVNLGGVPILLMSQKRLKVGDVYTISFEGQNYDLEITAITSITFSVRYRSINYTRATRLSGVSKQSRP
jgi:hypothetical protein